jgi:hypothetical protein
VGCIVQAVGDRTASRGCPYVVVYVTVNTIYCIFNDEWKLQGSMPKVRNLGLEAINNADESKLRGRKENRRVFKRVGEEEPLDRESISPSW